MGEHGVPSITIEDEVLESLARPWSNFVIIKLFRMSISYSVLERGLWEMWRPRGRCPSLTSTMSSMLFGLTTYRIIGPPLLGAPYLWSLLGRHELGSQV